jgi:hypothetical protein
MDNLRNRSCIFQNEKRAKTSRVFINLILHSAYTTKLLIFLSISQAIKATFIVHHISASFLHQRVCIFGYWRCSFARGEALLAVRPRPLRESALGERGKHKSGAIEACNNGSAAAATGAGRASEVRAARNAQCRCENEQEVVFDLGARAR